MEPSISDEQVLERANNISALLLTSDKDFGELVFRLRRLAAGVILLRLAGLANSEKADLVVHIIRNTGMNWLERSRSFLLKTCVFVDCSNSL